MNKGNFRQRFDSIRVPTDPPQATYTSAAKASSFYLRMVRHSRSITENSL